MIQFSPCKLSQFWVSKLFFIVVHLTLKYCLAPLMDGKINSLPVSL